MAYQAGQRNIQVATGADTILAVRFYQRGPNVAAADIVAGDFVIYQSKIWPVYSTTDAGGGKVTLQLGYGTFYEPELTMDDTDLVGSAVPAVWEAVDMQAALPETVWSPPPTNIPVPVTIEEDELSVVIHIGQEWLEPFQAQIDYAEGGPSGMSLPYDLVGQFDGRRLRILTGSISIIRSAASPVVDPPVRPEEVTP